MTRAITITSGKGGVGKTNISLNIALHLNRLGHKICLFDADLGLANINILLGIQPTYDICDLLSGEQTLADVLINAQGIDILPGSSGVEELANLEPNKLARLLKELTLLASYDYLLFDTSAGIAQNVIAFCLACPEILVVITPEPTSLTDAYALLKVLNANNYRGSIKIVINQCPDIQTAKKVYKRFKDAVSQFVGVPMEALGVIYKDQKVLEAVARQIPFLKLFPESVASKCIKKITERLLANQPEKFDQEIMNFWEKCLNFMTKPLELTAPKKNRPDVQVPETDTTSRHGSSGELPPKMPDQQSLYSAQPGIEQSLAMLAKSISEGIESITKELKEIRKELTNNHNAKESGATETSRKEITRPIEMKSIQLDLDHYVKEKNPPPEN